MPIGGGGCNDDNVPFPDGWCEGLAARFRGDELAARTAFTSARKELEQTVRDQPDYAAALCALGVIDAALGNKKDAIREGERAVELMPVSKSAVEGSMLIEYLAVIYAWGATRIAQLNEWHRSESARGRFELRPSASQPALGSAASVIRGLKQSSLRSRRSNLRAN